MLKWISAVGTKLFQNVGFCKKIELNFKVTTTFFIRIKDKNKNIYFFFRKKMLVIFL